MTYASTPPHALLYLDVDLALVEGLEPYLAQLPPQQVRHLQRQRGTRPAAKQPKPVAEIKWLEDPFRQHAGPTIPPERPVVKVSSG